MAIKVALTDVAAAKAALVVATGLTKKPTAAQVTSFTAAIASCDSATSQLNLAKSCPAS